MKNDGTAKTLINAGWAIFINEEVFLTGVAWVVLQLRRLFIAQPEFSPA